MEKNRDELAESLNTDSEGSLMGLLADEEDLDRRALWRLGSWAVGSIGALVLAILASQSSIQVRQEQAAAADLARQSQQIQRIAKEAQTETNRLAAAIDTLNGDRDRLYSRVTMLEQNVESVTGSIKHQAAGVPPSPAAAESRPAPQAAAPTSPPSKAPQPPATVTADAAEPPASSREQTQVRPAQAASLIPLAASTPPTADRPAPSAAAAAAATPPAAVDAAPRRPLTELQPVTPKPPAPLVAAKSMLGPPEPSAAKLTEPAAQPPAASPPAVAAADPEPTESDAPPVATQRTAFGVDLGGANSVEGLRILWQRLLKSNASLSALRPLLVVKERTSGAGMQLRLVAGPISDASTAARLCAGLASTERFCETAIYDGQRLSAGGAAPPATARPARKRNSARLPVAEPEQVAANPPPPPPPQPPASSSSSPLMTLLGVR